MSGIDITPPTPGSVTLVLPYEEAEVLLRAVGMVNTGNLRTVAPTLLKAMEELIFEFGRNLDHEARKYMASPRGGQVYVEDIYE